MSGPKYSTVIIERQYLQRMIAQLEKEIEQSKCNTITDNILKCKNKTSKLIDSIPISKYGDIISICESEIEDCSELADFKKQIDLLNTLLNQKFVEIGNSSFLAQSLRKYEERQKKIENIKFMIESLSKRLKDIYDKHQQDVKEGDFLSTTWKKNTKIEVVSPAVSKVYDKLIQLTMQYDDFEKIHEAFDEIMKNHNFDDEYKIAQLQMRYKSFMVQKLSDENAEKVLIMQSEYISIMQKLGHEYANVPQNSEELANKIRDLYVELKQKTTGEYIAESVEKVMHNLGYDILSSEVLTAQNMQKSYYDYSPNSTITVATSDSGAMMIEVNGKQKPTIFPSDKTEVRMDMEHFCPDYAKVKQGLALYGISLSNERLCKPDEKYVRFVDVKSNAYRRITKQQKRMEINNE